MSYLIVNDIHLELKRRVGVTKETQARFAELQANTLTLAVAEANRRRRRLIVLGDLFDRSLTSFDTVWLAKKILAKCQLPPLLCRGNHDQDRNAERMSAFDLLGRLLEEATVVTDLYELEAGCTVIPHMPNQDLFDKAIATLTGGTLLAHCNFNNFFTEQLDHSLNLTEEQAARFSHVILGHEHNKRDLPGVDVLGSPLPCNIAECSVPKGYHLWAGPGHPVEFVETWNPREYASVDWKDLDSCPPVSFIRVTGEATAEQAAQVIDELARFRTKTDAFIVTNSVMVGSFNLGEVETTEEELGTFNPLKLLYEVLPERLVERIRGLQCN